MKCCVYLLVVVTLLLTACVTDSTERMLTITETGASAPSPDMTVKAWPATEKTKTPIPPTPFKPTALTPLLRAVLEGHTDRVSSSSFSPDGTRIITASWDGTARVWDTDCHTVVAYLQGHKGRINSASFNPDGTRIITASDDGTARVWDTYSGLELALLQDHTPQIAYASFNPDGTRIVTSGSDGIARVWDAESSEQLILLMDHIDRVLSAGFDSDGSRIVTASADGTARVWEIGRDAKPTILFGHSAPVISASFSPDGMRILTASSDKTARVWDAESGEQLALLQGHTLAINSASFSPDGKRILTASDDGTARVWDIDNSSEPLIFWGHTDSVMSAAFSSDGTRIVTASWDNTARIWDTDSGVELAVLQGHTGGVTSAGFSSDGTLIITASVDNTARVWDVGAVPAALKTPTLLAEREVCLIGAPIPHFWDGQSTTITSIHMITPLNGWAIASDPDTNYSHVLHTDDGGNYWYDVTPPETAPIGGSEARWALGFFLDTETAWVTYRNHENVVLPDEVAVIWRTFDGGLSWQPSDPMRPPAFIDFVDADNGWTLTIVDYDMGEEEYISIHKTDDGGATWDTIISPDSEKNLFYCDKTGMDFVDLQTGLITRDCSHFDGVPVVDWTHDGGLTWDLQKLPPPVDDPDYFSQNFCGAQSPTLFSPESAMLAIECDVSDDDSILYAYFLYATDDGGQTWHANVLPDNIRYRSIAPMEFISPKVGWSQDRSIYKTRDGGQTWEHVKDVNWDGQFNFIDESVGWAVAQNEDEIALVYTADGGRTWSLLHPEIASSAEIEAEVSDDWKTYRNEVYGFEFKYPNDAKLEEDGDGIHVEFPIQVPFPSIINSHGAISAITVDLDASLDIRVDYESEGCPYSYSMPHPDRVEYYVGDVCYMDCAGAEGAAGSSYLFIRYLCSPPNNGQQVSLSFLFRYVSSLGVYYGDIPAEFDEKFSAEIARQQKVAVEIVASFRFIK